MNQCNKRNNELYFIALQVPNQVPLNVGRELGLLSDEFLNFVLAKNRLSGCQCLPYFFY